SGGNGGSGGSGGSGGNGGNGSETLQVVISASRLRGVAPLPVFFDGLATPLQQGSTHEAEWRWDFGDPTSNRPRASGFCAAHVFEQPGKYDVRLQVEDAGGNRGTKIATVQVDPFEGLTVYASSSTGNDGN